jgi:hypothetical protein
MLLRTQRLYTVSGTYTKLNDGCTANQELVLTVRSQPDAPVSSGNQTTCSDGTTTQTLTARATGGTIESICCNCNRQLPQVGVGTKTYYACC